MRLSDALERRHRFPPPESPSHEWGDPERAAYRRSAIADAVMHAAVGAGLPDEVHDHLEQLEDWTPIVDAIDDALRESGAPPTLSRVRGWLRDNPGAVASAAR